MTENEYLSWFDRAYPWGRWVAVAFIVTLAVTAVTIAATTGLSPLVWLLAGLATLTAMALAIIEMHFAPTSYIPD